MEGAGPGAAGMLAGASLDASVRVGAGAGAGAGAGTARSDRVALQTSPSDVATSPLDNFGGAAR